MRRRKDVKRLLVILCAVTLVFGVGTASAGVIFFDDSGGLGTGRTAWEAAVGGDYMEFAEYGASGALFPAGTGLDVGYGETLSFGADLQVLTIGSGWATWSGGYTGDVLYSLGATSVSATFGDGGILGGFGFEAEPNPFQVWDITLQLATGDTLTQAVQGDSGAKFFGWTSDMAVVGFDISSGRDFAIGRFVSAVPEPATLLLFGSGLIALSGLGRKRSQR
jgi:hypothetical protein